MINKSVGDSAFDVVSDTTKADRQPYETRYHHLKKYLHSGRRLDKKCAVLQYRIAFLEGKATEQGGLTDFDSCMLKELREKNRILQSLLEKRMVEIVALIDQMTVPMEREILKERYLRYKPWDVIAADFGMRERQAQLLHGCALTALDRLMNDSE